MGRPISEETKKKIGDANRGRTRHVCGVAYRDCVPCRRANARKWREANRQVWREGRERWMAANPERRKVWSRRHWLKKNYGLTQSQAAELFEQSDGLCAICYAEPATHIDHDHATGAIRGALCKSCNLGLGYFQDDPERLRLALSYLELHVLPAIPVPS